MEWDCALRTSQLSPGENLNLQLSPTHQPLRKQKKVIHSQGVNSGVFRTFNFKSHFHLQSDKEVIQQSLRRPKLSEFRESSQLCQKAQCCSQSAIRQNSSGLGVGSMRTAHRDTKANIKPSFLRRVRPPAFPSWDSRATFETTGQGGSSQRSCLWLGSADCRGIYCLCFTSGALFLLISWAVTQGF